MRLAETQLCIFSYTYKMFSCILYYNEINSDAHALKYLVHVLGNFQEWVEWHLTSRKGHRVSNPKGLCPGFVYSTLPRMRGSHASSRHQQSTRLVHAGTNSKSALLPMHSCMLAT